MRALGVALVVASLLCGCMSRPAQKDRSGEPGYNRRELTHAQPGILTGPDGTWTVYRNDAEPRSEEPLSTPAPAPKKREILMCDRSQHCNPED
jgi:hypothetical protein